MLPKEVMDVTATNYGIPVWASTTLVSSVMSLYTPAAAASPDAIKSDRYNPLTCKEWTVCVCHVRFNCCRICLLLRRNSSKKKASEEGNPSSQQDSDIPTDTPTSLRVLWKKSRSSGQGQEFNKFVALM